jgi:hypothetical protein
MAMTVIYDENKMTIDSAMELETSPGPMAKPRMVAMKAHQVSQWKEDKCDTAAKIPTAQ